MNKESGNSNVKLKIINSVFDVWSNLEDSYKRQGVPKGLSRSEYFKLIVGFKNNRHGLPLLLKKLNDVISDEELKKDEDVLDKYSKLTETFKILSNHLDENGIPSEIENLDLFLVNSMGMLISSTSREDIIRQYDYNSLEDNKINKFYHRIMLEEFGALIDYVYADKDGTINHYIGVECPTDNFRHFKRDMVYNYLKDGYSSPEFLKDKFNLDCLAVIAVLAKIDKIPNDFFVTSKDNIVENRLFGIGELCSREQISHSSIDIVEYKYEGISIFCLY